MIQLSLIYLAFTVLLAAVDAVRIRIVYGKKQNIDHDISFNVAVGVALIAITLYNGMHENTDHFHPWKGVLLLQGFGWPLCAFVRLAAYSPLLNLFRIITKTNPTARLDYVSTTTSSSVDNLPGWRNLSFWQQRGIAVAAWASLTLIFYLL